MARGLRAVVSISPSAASLPSGKRTSGTRQHIDPEALGRALGVLYEYEQWWNDRRKPPADLTTAELTAKSTTNKEGPA